MQELGNLKVVCLNHIRFHGVLLWNETAVDWLIVGMWFGAFTSLGAKIRTCGLVCPFVVQTTWFGIPNFCNPKGEWVEYGVKDHEIRDGNDVWVGFRLVKEPMRHIKSPLSKGVCQLRGLGWLREGDILITKVPVVIIDGVRWEQNLEMLIWLGKNILGFP